MLNDSTILPFWRNLHNVSIKARGDAFLPTLNAVPFIFCSHPNLPACQTCCCKFKKMF